MKTNKNRTRKPKVKHGLGRIVESRQPDVDHVIHSQRRVPERDGLLFDHDGADPADNPRVASSLRGLRALGD